MADERQNLPLPYRLSGPPAFRGRESRKPEPDPGKLPLLPHAQRFELKPPRRPWRRTLRQRLARSE
jgi:hypothetical protein